MFYSFRVQLKVFERPDISGYNKYLWVAFYYYLNNLLFRHETKAKEVNSLVRSKQPFTAIVFSITLKYSFNYLLK